MVGDLVEVSRSSSDASLLSCLSMITRAMSRRIDDDARGPSGGCRDAMLRWMPDTVSLISDLDLAGIARCGNPRLLIATSGPTIHDIDVSIAAHHIASHATHSPVNCLACLLSAVVSGRRSYLPIHACQPKSRPGAHQPHAHICTHLPACAMQEQSRPTHPSLAPFSTETTSLPHASLGSPSVTYAAQVAKMQPSPLPCQYLLPPNPSLPFPPTRPPRQHLRNNCRRPRRLRLPSPLSTLRPGISPAHSLTGIVLESQRQPVSSTAHTLQLEECRLIQEPLFAQFGLWGRESFRFLWPT
ncbi:hypothetical protein IWZ01DRAFT_127475 [Phyllosticta capitalensis]